MKKLFPVALFVGIGLYFWPKKEKPTRTAQQTPIPGENQIPPHIKYIIESGENLDGIAARHGVSSNQVLEFNNLYNVNYKIVNIHTIHTGKVIYIPKV